ncbi:hypothetical protein [Microbacterium sp. LWH7-1.2]|uniref:hypothetical protein n=1 Tax=Microbacterium sp. LWH7-1.2 TaxID=3135257 RepID=UPI003139CDDB
MGNGFFHSGSVASSARSVNYVYDCGARADTQSALTREVDELAERITTADFMFVSHFDFDHVSGIPSLTASVDIERFIIPMVPVPERLFILGGGISDGTLDGGPADTAFYDGFIIDPSAALAALGSNNATPAEVQVIPPAQATPTSGGAEPPELLSPRKIPAAALNAALTVRFESQRVLCEVGGDIVWEWFPYVAMQATGAIPEFTKALIRRKLIRAESEMHDSRRISHLVRRKREELARAYDDAVKAAGASFTRNLTSLMIYSGPVVGTAHRAYRTRNSYVERAEIGAWNPRPGWLGLGDADLRANKRVDEVNAAFESRKPYVGTFAPSHHGSAKDWDETLMTGFDPTAAHSPTYVFGAAGAYRSPRDKAVLHPDGDVLLAINEAGGTAVTVGMSEASRWTESLSVFVQP